MASTKLTTVSTPVGKCPIGLKGTDRADVLARIIQLKDEAESNQKVYSPIALKYRAGEFYPPDSTEYKTVCEIIDGPGNSNETELSIDPNTTPVKEGNPVPASKPTKDHSPATGYEEHDELSLFPEMRAEEFHGLEEDIKKHGQHEPIHIYQNKIIDGRHRYRACREPGIEPKVHEWNGTGSLVEYAISLNLHRRHLNTSQRSMVAANARPVSEKEAEQRQKAGKKLPTLPRNSGEGAKGESAEKAGKLLNVNKDSISKAQKGKRNGGQSLQKAVLNGTPSVSAAAEVADLPARNNSNW